MSLIVQALAAFEPGVITVVRRPLSLTWLHTWQYPGRVNTVCRCTFILRRSTELGQALSDGPMVSGPEF